MDTIGVVSRRWMWVESMGVVVRRYIDFLIVLNPSYSYCICYFLQQHPYFLFILKMFFVLVKVHYCNKILGITFFSHSINSHTSEYGHPPQPYEGLHIIFYTRRSTHKNEHFIPCDGHQLYAFKGSDVDLEVKGVRYIEMHRKLLTC